MKITDEILRVEKENNLFEFENKQGLKVWEAIRYSVNTQILRNYGSPKTPQTYKNNSTILFSLKRIYKFIFYSIRHLKCKQLFILASRSIIKDVYCDTIMDNILDASDKKNAFIIDTTYNWEKPNYKYGTVCPSLTTLMMRLYKPKYDFSNIIAIINKEFPYVELNIDEIKYFYSLFMAQYHFFNVFFRVFRFNKVFFVQAGIYKGLIAAAKRNHIKILELQHAQISRNHFAYSYPLNINPPILYNPDALLTFGPLWLKDSNFPGVEIIPIGNNFYCNNINIRKTIKKNILVVSTQNHHKKLMELVKEISQMDKSFNFIYKLHPEEFKNYNYYVRYFEEFKNVKVKMNEITISEAISQTELSLLIQSTVMVETLNAGKRVFVYKELDYEVMDFLYDEVGINFVTNADTFLETYKSIENTPNNQTMGRFFIPFNENIASSLLSQN